MSVSPGAAGMSDFENTHAPHRHGRFLRTLFTLAAQDPRCSPVSAAPIAILMVLGFLISGAWQVAAVYVAARYELGIESTAAVLAAGVLVAVLVIAFDWDLVHHRIRGESRLPMLVLRLVFVTIMALLVSEAVAGWVFDKDIARQVQVGNDQERSLVGQRVDADGKALASLDEKLVPLNKKVSDAQAKVDDAQREMDKQDGGFESANQGKGPLYEEAKFQRDAAQREFQRVKLDRDGRSVQINAQKKEIVDAQADFIAAHPVVEPADLGPAERERALWSYLLHNPDALLLRRVPLTIILVFFDLLAVILGWGVSRRIRERHIAWYAEVDRHEQRARSRRRALADAEADDYMEEQLESLSHRRGRRPGGTSVPSGASSAAGDLRGAHAAVPAPADHPVLASRRPPREWSPRSASGQYEPAGGINGWSPGGLGGEPQAPRDAPQRDLGPTEPPIEPTVRVPPDAHDTRRDDDQVIDLTRSWQDEPTPSPEMDRGPEPRRNPGTVPDEAFDDVHAEDPVATWNGRPRDLGPVEEP